MQWHIKHSTHANISLMHILTKLIPINHVIPQYHKLSSHGLRYNPAVHLETAHKITLSMLFTHDNNTTSHTNHTNSPWTVQNTLGISSIGPNLLEPKQLPSRPQQIPIHYMALKQEVKQVGEKPLPFRSLPKLPNTGLDAKLSL